MTFTQRLSRYAELIVTQGIAVQQGQLVAVSAEPIHRELGLLIVEAAYRRGAKWVGLDLAEPRATRVRLECAKEDSLDFVPRCLPARYDEILENGGATVKIVGSEFPDILSGLDPKRVATAFAARQKALKRFYDEGIGSSRVHWSVVAAATPQWAVKVFPDLTPDTACRKLWEIIFRLVRADRSDCLEVWQQHDDTLRERAKTLTNLKIVSLNFSGPGTNLTVALSNRAIFRGGSEMGPHGVRFQANIPTEEVFTTPDWRGTSGHVTVTRPVFVNGTRVNGLQLEFKDGEIVAFSATEGEATFAEYIATDVGAKRLGEVALVGIDSPVFESGLVFEEILFDENAACHIAIGSAYKFCLDGGDKLGSEELAALGCNESLVHTDFMISSPEVDVTATNSDGREIALLKRGRWVAGL